MSKLSQINVAVGFLVVFISACAGSFIAFDLTENFIHDPTQNSAWSAILQRSAHGHFNMFGILHILLGLSLHYSSLGAKPKLWQSVGLGLGTIAMGPIMFLRSYGEPSANLDGYTIVLGSFLSLALVALASHFYGICLKLNRR